MWRHPFQGLLWGVESRIWPVVKVKVVMMNAKDGTHVSFPLNDTLLDIVHKAEAPSERRGEGVHDRDYSGYADLHIRLLQ